MAIRFLLQMVRFFQESPDAIQKQVRPRRIWTKSDWTTSNTTTSLENLEQNPKLWPQMASEAADHWRRNSFFTPTKVREARRNRSCEEDQSAKKPSCNRCIVDCMLFDYELRRISTTSGRRLMAGRLFGRPHLSEEF